MVGSCERGSTRGDSACMQLPRSLHAPPPHHSTPLHYILYIYIAQFVHLHHHSYSHLYIKLQKCQGSPLATHFPTYKSRPLMATSNSMTMFKMLISPSSSLIPVRFDRLIFMYSINTIIMINNWYVVVTRR